MEIKLQEFIRKTIDEIAAALPKDYVIEDAIDFEVSVTTSTNKSGGVEVKILSGAASKGNKVTQKVFFSVVNHKHKTKADSRAASNVVKFIDKGIKAFNRQSNQSNSQ